MQEVGGAGRLSEDGCASAYKDSLNCALRIERKRENATREKQRAATRRNGADWVDRRSPPFLDLLFLPSKKKKKKIKKKKKNFRPRQERLRQVQVRGLFREVQGVQDSRVRGPEEGARRCSARSEEGAAAGGRLRGRQSCSCQGKAAPLLLPFPPSPRGRRPSLAPFFFFIIIIITTT